MSWPLPRSLLYVPAVKPQLFDKAAAGPADAVIIDLEDSVPLQDKAVARRNVAEWLAHRAPTETAIWIRASAEFLTDDIDVAALPGVAGILVAKCDPDSIQQADRTLTRLEQLRNLGQISVVGLLETARALKQILDMAEYSRLRTFGIGEVDLLADLRLARSTTTESIIDSLRVQVVVDCAAAGLDAPIAPTSTDIPNLDGFAETTGRFVAMGFRGRTALHPSQVPIINNALTPSAEDVNTAQRIVDLYRSADGRPLVDEAGKFIDEAVVRGAREILARA